MCMTGSSNLTNENALQYNCHTCAWGQWNEAHEEILCRAPCQQNCTHNNAHEAKRMMLRSLSIKTRDKINKYKETN